LLRQVGRDDDRTNQRPRVEERAVQQATTFEVR